MNHIPLIDILHTNIVAPRYFLINFQIKEYYKLYFV